MKLRSAIKTDLFADEHHRTKVNPPGAPAYFEIAACWSPDK
ncbi:hypothetical protein [Thauera mechernichensis]